MAKETIVRLRDDIDSSDAVKTIQFTWGASTYEIDLSAKNAKAFEQAVAPYVAAARRLTPVRRGAAKRAGVANAKLDLAVVREWAAKNGHKVAERGRISAVVVDAFHASQRAVVSAVSEVASAQKPARKTTARRVAKTAPARNAAAKRAVPRKAAAKRVSAKKAVST